MYSANPTQEQTRLAIILVSLKALLLLTLPDVWVGTMVVFLLLSLQTQTQNTLSLPNLELVSYGHRTKQLTFLMLYGNVEDQSIRHLDIAIPGIVHFKIKIDGSRSHLFDLLGLSKDCCSTGFTIGSVVAFYFFKTLISNTMGVYWSLDVLLLLKKAYSQTNRTLKDIALVELEVNHQLLQLDVTHQETETRRGLNKIKEQYTQVNVLNQPELSLRLKGTCNFAQSIIALKANLATK